MFLTTNRAQSHDLTKSPAHPDPDCLHSLFSRQAVEHLDAGRSLFMEGDAAQHVFEILEGTLRVFRIISDGRRVITGFAHPGDIIGVSMRGIYLNSAEAINPTRLRRLNRRSFDTTVNNFESLRPQVFHKVCEEMAAAQDQMVLLSTKNAEERLCTFLLRQLKRTQSEGVVDTMVDLPMTRLDIADYLGLTIETVSRTMTKLMSKGILVNAGRHSVKIMKPSVLAQLAGDGDEYEDARRDLTAHGERRRH